ncbi:MAG: hypothetical protein ACRDQU_16980 [Pseudonocardiaceae bacterium]
MPETRRPGESWRDVHPAELVQAVLGDGARAAQRRLGLGAGRTDVDPEHGSAGPNRPEMACM